MTSGAEQFITITLDDVCNAAGIASGAREGRSMPPVHDKMLQQSDHRLLEAESLFAAWVNLTSRDFDTHEEVQYQGHWAARTGAER